VVRGLNERFSHVGALLRRSWPFPTFLEARDDLILEELTLENRKESPTSALAASTASSSPSATPPPSNTGSGGVGGHKSSNNNRRSKCSGGGKGGSGGGSTAGQAQRPPSGTQQQQQPGGAHQTAAGAWPWPTVYNPWMGSIQMWPGGPRPPLAPIPVPPQQLAQQQALLAQ
jgi:hypothetical protein